MIVSEHQPAHAAHLPLPARAEAARVATAQYAAFVALLRDLDEADWARSTDCTGWSVREVAAHVTGAADEGAHLRVLLRHLRAARRAGGASVDRLNAAQLADRAHAPGQRLVAELARLAPKAVRARRRAPGVLRRRVVPGDDLPAASTFAYLFDVIYSRDVFMHRVDVERACGRAVPAVPEDADVLAQVVRDLARFWTGPAVALQLTGPSGGAWLIGDGTPVAEVRVDAVEYLRLLSGRAAQPELQASGDPAARAPVLAARVVF